MSSGEKSTFPKNHAQMVKAAAHPLRARALAMMIDRPTSPAEVAAAVGEPIGNVAYRVRALERAGLIELIEERKSRGAPAHFYQGTNMTTQVIDDEEWGALSPERRVVLSTVIAHLIISDVGLALDAGTLDARTDRHFSRAQLELDEAGWGELREIFSSALQATLLVKARSKERLRKTGGDTFKAAAALMFFEMPEI